MCLDKASGILAIIAEAILRALDLLPIDAKLSFVRGPSLNHCVPAGAFRPSGFRPFPLVVLWAMLNHEPPVFLMALWTIRLEDSRQPFGNHPELSCFVALYGIGINAGTSPQR